MNSLTMTDDCSIDNKNKLMVKTLNKKQPLYNNSYHSIEAHRFMDSDD